MNLIEGLEKRFASVTVGTLPGDGLPLMLYLPCSMAVDITPEAMVDAIAFAMVGDTAGDQSVDLLITTIKVYFQVALPARRLYEIEGGKYRDIPASKPGYYLSLRYDFRQVEESPRTVSTVGLEP
jgi:hypothetical protein